MDPGGRETEKGVKRQGRHEMVKQLGDGDLPAKGWVVGPRLWLFRMTALTIIPVILLVFIELCLRITGFGYPTSAIIGHEIDGRWVRINNLKFGWRFFSPKQTARETRAFVFPAVKSPQTYRIFVLGGSAAMGIPEPAYGFSRILKVLLDDAYQGLKFEVINLGIPVINSHGVLEIAKDCARYEPDLFIVYLGNNEVIGPYGVGTVFTPFSPSLSFIRASIAVKSTRLGQLLDGLLSSFAAGRGRPARWIGLPMFLKKQVRFDSQGLQYVYKHYENNLTDICNIGREAGAEVILCNVATNLKDCPPFASIHNTGLDQTEKAMWKNVYNRAVEFESGNKYTEALENYQSAVEIDEQFAELHFRIGRCLWMLGDYAKARNYYVMARALDTLRFRADDKINETINRVAKKAGGEVTFVDVIQACRDASPYGIPGEELFYEYVHFNFKGNYLLARTVFEQVEKTIREQKGIKRSPSNALPTEEDCAARLAYTGWDRLRVIRKLFDEYISRPPFTNQAYHEDQVGRIEKRIKFLEQYTKPEGLQECIKQYQQAIEWNPSDWQLHWKYGQFLHKALGSKEEAVTQLSMVLEELPDCYIYNELSVLFYKQGKVDEGLTMARRALEMKPLVAWAYYNVGLGHDKKGQLKRAVKYYSKALELNPEVSVSAYNSLAQVLNLRGRSDKAIEILRDGIKVFPQNAYLHYRLGVFLKDQGKITDAANALRTALTIRPDYNPARNALSSLQAKSQN